MITYLVQNMFAKQNLKEIKEWNLGISLDSKVERCQVSKSLKIGKVKQNNLFFDFIVVTDPRVH